MMNDEQQKLLDEKDRISHQPQWFREALAQKPISAHADFGGKKIHYLDWRQYAPAHAPQILLVHGSGAHAHWFDFIAPLLTPYYGVVAMDFPGMGDSDWLDAYSREIKADSIRAMIEQAQFSSKPVLIAHSYGGFVALIAAHHHTDKITALMLCDFAIKPPEHHEEWYDGRRNTPPMRVYETKEAILARYRLAPAQPCTHEYILQHIAAHSIRQTTGGWTWKFDSTMHDGYKIGDDLPDIYRGLSLPSAAMFGALSHMEADRAFHRQNVKAYMRELRPDIPFYEIAGAHHHIMLDQPHGFVASITTQMESWRAQNAFRI